MGKKTAVVKPSSKKVDPKTSKAKSTPAKPTKPVAKAKKEASKTPSKPVQTKAAPKAADVKTLRTAGKVSRSKEKTPKPTISTKPGMPVLKIVLCGPHSVYWIPKDTDIPQNLFLEGLHAKEQEMAKEFKAPTRKQEFLRARWLFRRVIKVKEPLLKAKTGEPLWPQGFLGSISHKDGHVLFCKASTDSHHCLGMDIEKVNKVSEHLESKICTPEEGAIIDRVSALARYKRQEVLALIFSFKEAIFKTHFPTGKKNFSFHDVTITDIAYDRREIFARMNIDTSPHSSKGHVTMGFYNWIDCAGEKFVVVVAEERKPMAIDPSLKAELLAEVEVEA